MVFILMVISGICICSIFINGSALSYGFDYGAEKWYLGVSIGFLILAIACFYLILSQPYITEKSEVSLAAMASGQSINGQFYLLAGSIDTSVAFKYVYYPDPNNKKIKAVDVLDNDNVTILEDNSQIPKLKITKKYQKHNEFSDTYKYEFVIPENSVKEVYDIDVRK